MKICRSVCKFSFFVVITLTVVIGVVPMASAENMGLFITFLFEHIYFATFRPAIGSEVIAQEPHCRPGTFGSRQFGFDFHFAVFETIQTFSFESCRSIPSTAIGFGCNFEHTVFNFHIFGVFGVCLQLVITPTITTFA